MQDLKITLIQTDLHWESPAANMAMLEEKIWQINDNPDLIILPEMFTTGFSMNATALAEHMNMSACRWMKQQASQTGAVVTGSVIIKEGSKFFNRLLWVEPSGEISFYDKRHLFRMAGEEQTYASGKTLLIKEIKGWKICPLICYDLRFPVWSRNVNNQYDLVIYVANWPAARSAAWQTLLPARAVENLSYSIGLNRVGLDGKGNLYNGNSGAWDFKGDKVLDLKESDTILTVSLNKSSLHEFRTKFPAYLDADIFEIKQ